MLACVYLLEPRGTDCTALAKAFRAAVPAGWTIEKVATVDALLRAVHACDGPPLVILPPLRDGKPKAAWDLLGRVRRAEPDVPVVATAESGNVELAGQAIAAGATDFLVCGANLPQRIATLVGKLAKLLEALDRNRRLDRDNAALRDMLQQRLPIVGRSARMRRLLRQIQRVAKVPRPVLIAGERGTGKELVARAIHLAAGAADRPMITVNCAAFSDSLLESELFGHERGAFTGADAQRRGKFELADGGTLFLDEIGNMSPAFQEKILRVVEYGTFTRVGGTEELHTGARIIAATNRDLKQQIAAGAFLADLYDRLAFETVEIPPLREREGDIPILAQWFLEQFARETPAVAGKRLSEAAMAALSQYNFPGNVRELKNIIERAACRETGEEILPEDLGLSAGGTAASPSSAVPSPQSPIPNPQSQSFHAQLDGFAAHLIAEALARSGGNQAQAARQLGLPYHQFRYYLHKYVDPRAVCPHCGAARHDG